MWIKFNMAFGNTTQTWVTMARTAARKPDEAQANKIY